MQVLAVDRIAVIVEFIREKLSPELIVLFGSAAHGTGFGPDSDIDLAFKSGRTIDDHDRLGVLLELAAKLRRDVDLIDLRKADPLLKFEIAQDGMVLYQAEPMVFIHFQVHAMHEHEDAQKFFRFDHEYIRGYLEVHADDPG